MNGFPWGDFGVNLAASAAVAAAVMLATFAVALVKGVHRIVDVAWGLGFTAVAALSFALSSGSGDETRRVLVSVLTAVWGLRLAGHIAMRGRGHGEDPRYARMLAKAPGSRNLYALRMVYLLQAALVWLVSLPVQAAQYVPGPAGGPQQALMAVGVAAWLTGVFFETVGDAQLARFKADSEARDRMGFRIMDRGLWRYTRHPNYFGDFMVWWGLFLLACGDVAVAALCLVSPVVMSLLLTMGSGMRLLERQLADRPGYAAYAARTSPFFPWPPRRTTGGDGHET